MSSTNVRRATPADATGVARVHVRSWQVGYRGLVPDEILDGLSVAGRERTWHALLERPTAGAFTLVAAERDRIVGFCSVIAPARDDDAGASTGEIAAVYVDPDHWRAGIGSALLATALRELGAAGWDDVTLGVFAENDLAVAFCRGFAIAADGARMTDAHSGQDEIRLRAPIQAPPRETRSK